MGFASACPFLKRSQIVGTWSLYKLQIYCWCPLIDVAWSATHALSLNPVSKNNHPVPEDKPSYLKGQQGVVGPPAPHPSALRRGSLVTVCLLWESLATCICWSVQGLCGEKPSLLCPWRHHRTYHQLLHISLPFLVPDAQHPALLDSLLEF